ncbi:hypothetical protein Tco_0265734 [Tanacetum coccineum]
MVVATKPTTIQSDVLKAGMLTDEASRNGSLRKNAEKKGNDGEPSKDGNARDDNKRSRTGRVFATITNHVRKEYTGMEPKCLNCNHHHQPEVPCRCCTNCNRYGIAKDFRVRPRVVNPLNARNLTTARGAYFECDGTDHYKAACPRVLGERPEEKVRHLKVAKVKELKLKEIVVVRNFSKVFPDDLSGLPPSREIKFCIDLILGAMSVAKSPYCLAPSEIEELSSQLRELQDKGFLRPSSSP